MMNLQQHSMERMQEHSLSSMRKVAHFRNKSSPEKEQSSFLQTFLVIQALRSPLWLVSRHAIHTSPTTESERIPKIGCDIVCCNRLIWAHIWPRNQQQDSVGVQKSPKGPPNEDPPKFWKVDQGECSQFFFPPPHEAAVWPSTTIAKKNIRFSIRMSSSLLKCLILMVASVVKNPTMIRVTALCGWALSERALWHLLKSVKFTAMWTTSWQVLPPQPLLLVWKNGDRIWQ